MRRRLRHSQRTLPRRVGDGLCVERSQSFIAGCTAEWFVHSSLAVYGVAFVVWPILNLSRVLLVSSYKKLRLGSTSYQDVRQSVVRDGNE